MSQSPWEDPSLAAAFPPVGAVPERFRVDPAAHPARWLVDGELRRFQGPSRTVTSRVALAGGGPLRPTPLGEEALLTAAEAGLALAAAQRAYDGGEGAWPRASVEERFEAVRRFAAALEARVDEVATLLMWEIGKPWPSARDEVTRSVEYIQNTLDEFGALRDAQGEVQRGLTGRQPHLARTHRRSLGVVLCVAPFNYPVNEFLTTVVPALLMGNVVLAKTPRHGVLANLVMAQAFRDSFPPGVVALLPGEGRVVLPALMGATRRDLWDHPVGAVDVLAFIGSESAANAILKAHPVPITLHKVLGLGAKNLAVVLPGADLDAAAAALTRGRWASTASAAPPRSWCWPTSRWPTRWWRSSRPGWRR